MATPLQPRANRRFSLGGPMPLPATIEVWKFDAVLKTQTRREIQATCYVRCSLRGDAFQAFFAAWPGAQIHGTGLPLTAAQCVAEQSRQMKPGEVLAIDEAGQVVGRASAS